MPIPAVVRDGRALATLAVPLALTQLAQVVLMFTDTVMMGLISSRALAAGGITLVIFNQLRTMGVGMITAIGNQVAAATARVELASLQNNPSGAADSALAADPHGDVRDLIRAALAVATLTGLCGAALIILCGRALPLLGQDPQIAANAQPMLLALAPGLLPCLWFQAIRQFTVGMRRPQALLRITLAAVAVNAALNWAFIHGTAGLPELGLTGIGLASSFVHLISFLALYLAARRDPALAPVLSLKVWLARRSTLCGLVRLGVPIAATYGSEAGFFSTVALMVGSFGSAALAAQTAVNQLVYIAFQIAVGLSHAASIGVSREVALGKFHAAERLRRTALACGSAVMAVIAFLYLTVPELVLRPFFDPNAPEDRTAMAIGVNLLLIAAVLQFFGCAQTIGVGLLRGLNDTIGSFRATLIGHWAVGLPTAWLLGTITSDHSPLGIWLGLLTGLATTALLTLRRYSRGLARSRTESVPAFSAV